jgi:uncharacterized FAD-dependent dehydrogenase
MLVVTSNSGFQGGKVPLKYDVIIVGAGPAGIFSALELTENTNLNVLVILDRGADIDKRKCPSSRGFECVHCEPCSYFQVGAAQVPTVTANSHYQQK